MKPSSLASLSGLLAVLVFSGCATHQPLPRLEYRAPAAAGAAPEKHAPVATGVSLASGEAVGHALTSYALMPGGWAMPIKSGPSPVSAFNAEDQAAFLENLARVLTERGVIKVVAADAPPDATIAVKFLKTEHFPEMQDYVLDALVTAHAGDRTYEKVHHVSTIDGVNVVARMFQNAIDGRRHAAELLLAAVVPDLERWFAAAPADLPPEAIRLPRPFVSAAEEIENFLREHYTRPSSFWKDGVSVIARHPSASVTVIELRWSNSDVLPPFCTVDIYAENGATRIEIRERNPLLSSRVKVKEAVQDYVHRAETK